MSCALVPLLCADESDGLRCTAMLLVTDEHLISANVTNKRWISKKAGQYSLYVVINYLWKTMYKQNRQK